MTRQIRYLLVNRVDRIGEWIENIIMCYGYHVEYGSREQFVQDFTNWCNNIPKGERYILPKYIYRYSKSLNRQDVNSMCNDDT